MEHKDETTSLIAIGKVKNTDVYDTDGEHLGVVDDVIIDKRTGQIAAAVVKFGTVLGLGGDTHQVPWNSLKYDTLQGGYVLGVPVRKEDGAPAFSPYMAAI
ncbi:PRC-barrel domain-containing protein [Xanthobacteraceae bacterium A53D]